MSAEHGQPSLNELLAQTADAYGLRDVLARRGIPKDEIVICNIEYDGEGIASYQIPSSCDEVPDVPFLNDLREEVLDILNRGEDEFGLLSAFPETQTSLFALNLSVGTVEIGEPPVEFPCVKSGIMFFLLRPCPPRPVCAI